MRLSVVEVIQRKSEDWQPMPRVATRECVMGFTCRQHSRVRPRWSWFLPIGLWVRFPITRLLTHAPSSTHHPLCICLHSPILPSPIAHTYTIHHTPCIRLTHHFYPFLLGSDIDFLFTRWGRRWLCKHGWTNGGLGWCRFSTPIDFPLSIPFWLGFQCGMWIK